MLKIYNFIEKDGERKSVIADGILDAIKKANLKFPVSVKWSAWVHCGGDCGDCQGCIVQEQAR